AGGADVTTGPVADGGTGAWGIKAEPRVQAVMGLAIGAQTITRCANLTDVTVPALLVAGGRDINSRPEVSEDAFNRIASTHKAFETIAAAVHRSFDSTYCAQLQAAGAIAQANTRAILDRQTVAGIVVAPISGVAMS